MENIKASIAGFACPLFRRKQAQTRRAFVLRQGRGWVTLPRLLVAVALLTVGVVVVQVAGPRLTAVSLAGLALLALALVEGFRRRKWERAASSRIQQQNDDILRLMRDLARQRQETAQMRETLAGAGAALEKQAGRGGDAEQRLWRGIGQALSQLGLPVETGEGDALFPAASALDIAIVERHAADDGYLDENQVLQLIRAAVEQDRFDLFVQPIVTLPQRKERFVEAFSRIRIRSGVYMPAERYVGAARERDLLPAIDNLLLLKTLTALKRAAGRDSRRVFFCNVTGLTLHDPKFMTDLVEFIAQNRELARQLVFELTQHDMSTLRHDILPVLAGLAHLGCRFSMDQVKKIDFSAEEMANRFVRFVKIDAALLMQVMAGKNGREKLVQFKSALDLEGIDLIVEKVENERDLVEILDVGIDYGQGYLFGPPAPETPVAA